jgi:3-methyladenine DNA glycosylase/8-oxoguanine DNA glycosylase
MKTNYLDTPKNFDFKRTIYSHGWSELLPFEIDTENLRLSYIFDGERATIYELDGKLKVENVKESNLKHIEHILRFDENLSEFYKLTKSEKEFAWIAKANAGRLLRSPNVFEDLVKTICTTNCSWAMTKIMVKNLVEKLGENGSFPTAEAMANQNEKFYKDEIRAGYRSNYFAELAEKVAIGKLNPESWLQTNLSTKDLKKEIKQVKGVGDYAAENLLKLLGRYDGLALDSWLRGSFYKRRNNGNTCDDKEIEKYYERFGKWKGLVIWLDMNQNWLL